MISNFEFLAIDIDTAELFRTVNMAEENYTHGILIYNSTNVRLYNNSINTLGDISDGVSIYISNYTSIYNNTIINSGYNGHGIYNSFSSYNNITNFNFF